MIVVSEEMKLFLAGIVFLLSSLVCFKVPWEFIREYEIIKDNEILMRRYSIMRKVYGYALLISGILTIIYFAYSTVI